MVHAELSAGGEGSARFELTQAHRDNHSAYIKHWIEASRRDPMAIFIAIRDAEKVAGYMLGLERELRAEREQAATREWVAEYEREPMAGR
ncbi:MAG: hypothetical protein V4505_25365 [Pseudomonadota bacterium]